MKFISIIFFTVFLALGLIADENKEYKFNWYPNIKVLNEDKIKFPNSSKFEVYNTTGVWEDNIGNYGIMKCVISQFIRENKEIILDGYCEARDYNREMFWIKLERNSFNKIGVGKGKFLFTQTRYKALREKECPYAAQLLEGGGVFKLKCKLSKEEYINIK